MAIAGEFRIRLIVLIGASVFLLSAVALIAFPEVFGEFINITGDSAIWALRMTGVVLLPLSYSMFILRATASNHTIRSFAVLMILVSTALGIITLMAPGASSLGRWLYAVVGFAFALAYSAAIILSPRSR
jgi:O-antigen/teichoic acid export membrane protein